MMTKPHDKITEWLKGKTFAKLRYQHPAGGRVESLKVDA